MKLIINGDWGGYSLPEEYMERYEELRAQKIDERTDEVLVALVESEDYEGDLEVVEVPDEATDYIIQDYDGMESVLYVVDGKIHYLD